MSKECEVCAYLSQYEDKETISYVNGIIKKGLPYKDIEKECYIKPVPTEEIFNKHKQKCLKDFIDEELNLNTPKFIILYILSIGVTPISSNPLAITFLILSTKANLAAVNSRLSSILNR